MPIDPSPPSDAEILQWFGNTPDPPRGTFEIALALGGTVAAGAYTAGVLDFLVEALDEWSRLQPGNAEIPPHKVILRVVTGTSGGGVNASILSRALAFDFPHVTRATDPDSVSTGNPFYDLWVNNVSLKDFLSTDDIDSGKFVSLLNGNPLEAAANRAAAFPNTSNPQMRALRSWIGQPLNVFLTLTNLHGVPYRTQFGSEGTPNGETFVDHADAARFAVVYPGQVYANVRPDELVLGFGNARLAQAIDWGSFAEFAKGSCAFPLGFPARLLTRPMEHLRWRVAALPSDNKDHTARIAPLVPDWNALLEPGEDGLPNDYRFLAVDGGATDNEPIEISRTALAGMLGRNPRNPRLASRAVLLVDPFAGINALGPDKIVSFWDAAASILQMFVQQTRYDTSDLVLALDETVFSRFMISPSQFGSVGGNALASGGLGAFIGFACRAFTRYDYLLGRANAQAFLRREFMLDSDNPLFDGWPAALKLNPKYLVTDAGTNQTWLPIIPLVGDAATTEAIDPWPRGKLNPEDFRDAIEERFGKIVEFEGTGGLTSSVVSWLVAHLGESTIADLVIKEMSDALKQWHLL